MNPEREKQGEKAGAKADSQAPVMAITAFSVVIPQTIDQRCFMPIFFMAVIALGVFLAMGLMLFYATYCEVKQAHEAPTAKAENVSPELKTHAPVA